MKPFETYLRLMLELHELIRCGAGESEAADNVRDEMDAPWKKMSSEELELVERVSVELD